MYSNKEYSLIELFHLIKGKAWLIGLCMILVASGGFVTSKFLLETQYTATVSLYIAPNRGDIERAPTINDLEYAQQVAKTYVEILQTNSFLKEVALKSGLGYSLKDMRDSIDIKIIENTEIFKIHVTTGKPRNSLIIADTMASLASRTIMGIAEVDGVRIVDPATLPDKPSAPNLLVNTAIGALLGVVLAIMGLIILDVTDKKIRNEEELSENYSVSVLGIVPGMPDVILGEAGQISNIGEMDTYRKIRANILLRLPKNGCQIIAITSPDANEGRTAATINVGVALALTGKKVLLMDCDIRKPAIYEHLKLNNMPGLTELLVHSVKPEVAIQQTKCPNLSVICSGRLASNYSELIAGGEMKQVLTSIETSFDYIIMAIPAENQSGDIAPLSELAHGVVIFVIKGKTTHPEMKKTLSTLHLAKANILGIVISNKGGERG